MDEMEDRLRAARPAPRDEFVRELEGRVLPPPHRAAPLLAAVVLVGTLATILVVLGVAGALPLGLGSEREVDASSDCSTVMTKRTERRPVFGVGTNGRLRLDYRDEVVFEPRTRCR
jgi:hypothetical protein